MCKFGANRTTSTPKSEPSRGDIFAMAKMRRVSGFWRFLGKYLGTGPKIPYWEPTGENPWISGPEYIPTLNHFSPASAPPSTPSGTTFKNLTIKILEVAQWVSYGTL